MIVESIVRPSGEVERLVAIMLTREIEEQLRDTHHPRPEVYYSRAIKFAQIAISGAEQKGHLRRVRETPIYNGLLAKCEGFQTSFEEIAGIFVAVRKNVNNPGVGEFYDEIDYSLIEGSENINATLAAVPYEHTSLPRIYFPESTIDPTGDYDTARDKYTVAIFEQFAHRFD